MTSGAVKVAFFRSPNTDEPSMRASLAPCLPALATGRLVESVSCKYTLTPDHHFVIGLHPHHGTRGDRVAVLRPWIQIRKRVGEILADLATAGATRHPIGLFAPSRFQ